MKSSCHLIYYNISFIICLLYDGCLVSEFMYSYLMKKFYLLCHDESGCKVNIPEGIRRGHCESIVRGCRGESWYERENLLQ